MALVATSRQRSQDRSGPRRRAGAGRSPSSAGRSQLLVRPATMSASRRNRRVEIVIQ